MINTHKRGRRSSEPSSRRAAPEGLLGSRLSLDPFVEEPARLAGWLRTIQIGLKIPLISGGREE